MVEEEIVKSVCRMCHGVCQVNVHLRNNKVIKISGDKLSPTRKPRDGACKCARNRKKEGDRQKKSERLGKFPGGSSKLTRCSGKFPGNLSEFDFLLFSF